ncbi:MAG TPA: alpha/beta fold hydrolase, partial [Acidimicrobiales bacterium]|nr:alpha/beta fold hydrolase [Acidimicrobiales bacterium]
MTVVLPPHRQWLNLAYATLSPAQKLDLYVPIGTSGALPGLVVYVHGGAWLEGDKQDAMSLEFVSYFLSQGFAIASVNYRLSGAAIFPAQIQDVKAAVRWLRASASTYGYSAQRFAALGDSSGGNLVALLGTSESSSVFDDPGLGNSGVSSSVKAVVDLFGDVDLLSENKWLEANPACVGQFADPNAPTSAASRYIGAPIQSVPARAEAANPVTYLRAGELLPRFLIAHGDDDCTVPYQGSVDLYQAIVKVAGPGAARLMIVKGSEHEPYFDYAAVLPVAVHLLDSTIGPPVPPQPAGSPAGGSSAAPAGAVASLAGPLPLSACTVAGHNALCGVLMVPENRLTGTGPQIPIRVVVVPAPGPGRLADPIVWTVGGPGDSAVDTVQRDLPLFFFNTHRDLVFVDQRGTGGANELTCPAFYSVLPELGDKPALRASVQQCLQHLKANLAFYTTAMAADDLNEVLGDLGYAKVNLVGISYGTTVAQVFLMRHPARVRTMTLLSGTLLTIPVFERFPLSGQDALDTVISECARNVSCHHAFPRLSSDWSTLWNALQKAPIVATNGRQSVALSADVIASDLHVLMTEPNSEAAMPLIIHTLAVAKNRGAAVVAIAGALAKAGIVIGPLDTQNMIKYPIECGEHWARDQASGLVDSTSFEYHVDLTTAEWWQYVCSLFPHSTQAAQYGTPTTSKVPVLALNGDADPQDPPAN